MTITRDEWLQALADAGIQDKRDEQDAVTIQEFMILMDGMPRNTARDRLGVLVKTGKAKKTWKRVTTDGHIAWRVAYRLQKEV